MAKMFNGFRNLSFYKAHNICINTDINIDIGRRQYTYTYTDANHAIAPGATKTTRRN